MAQVFRAIDTVLYLSVVRGARLLVAEMEMAFEPRTSALSPSLSHL